MLLNPKTAYYIKLGQGSLLSFWLYLVKSATKRFPRLVCLIYLWLTEDSSLNIFLLYSDVSTL